MHIILTILLVIIITTALSKQQPSSSESSVELTNRMYNNTKYNEGEYFVDNKTGIERGCLCMKLACTRKCCPFGQVYNVTASGCQNSTIIFNPFVWDEFTEAEEFNVLREIHIIEGKITCNTSLKEDTLKVYPAVDDYSLKMDGNLYVKTSSGLLIFGPEMYCMDTFVDDPEVPEDRINALLCYPSIKKKYMYKYLVISSACRLVSCFFILLTVGVYAWLPELRNLHGMVHIAYLLSFFISFLFNGCIKIMLLNNAVNTLYCYIFSLIIYFFFFAGFFWLNLMCYEIWSTLSGKRGQRLISDNMSNRKRFLKYSAYTMGVPAVMTALLAVLQYSSKPQHRSLPPKLTKYICSLTEEAKQLVYWPLTLLCVANLILFTLTALNIAKTRRRTKQMMSSSESSLNSQDNMERFRFVLYLKLFIITGFGWIFEVLRYFHPEAEVWHYTNAYNGLFGVLIFIIFICKKSVFRMIIIRYKTQRNSSAAQGEQTTSAVLPSQS